MKTVVLVRGFDYGTTEEQIIGHMSGAGTIVKVQMFDQGSACVTYSYPGEAKVAVQALNQTMISGNSRYIDVLPMDPEEFLAGHNIDMDKVQQFMALTPVQQQAVMAKGSLSTARDPTAVLASRMKQVTGMASGKVPGSGGGPMVMPNLGGSFDVKCAVQVRGFDFGTSCEQILGHMSGVGAIQNVQMIDRGSVCVTYNSAEESSAAVQTFNQTIIPGNTRYIDVFPMRPGIPMGGMGTTSANASKLNGGCIGGRGSSSVGKCAVLVRGFDYGTTDEQITGHMSGAGTIVKVQMFDQGSACVTYSYPEEAKVAVQALNQTMISGNGRYIDVSAMDPEEFLAGHNIDMDKCMQFMALAPELQQAVMAKGSLSSARDPTAVLATRMKQGLGMGGMGMTSANGVSSVGSWGNSSMGKFAVLVRGFDYGTTDKQIASHMAGAGAIVNVQMFDQGAACVTYNSAVQAKAAVQMFNQTIILGNSRYLDVIYMDPQEFVAGYNIDMDKHMQFMALSPAQQQAVMAKGSLSSARDPSAVLAVRMKQVAAGGGKGSFGPAQGCGGGMKASMDNGPYGGGGFAKGGSMGQGDTNKLEMLLQVAQMLAGNWGGDGGSW